MFSRLIAKLICLATGSVAGFVVYTNFKQIFEGWIPLASAAGVVFFVFSILYFPLCRPIADIISDRLSVAVHRGRHIRAGSGLDDIPQAPSAPICSICGGPDGPICSSCETMMNK